MVNRDEHLVRAKWERQGWEVIRAGWPDFLCVKRVGEEIVGVACVEVKPPRQHLSDRQKAVKHVLEYLGVDYRVESATGIEEDETDNFTSSVEAAIYDPEARSKILNIAATRDIHDWGIAYCCLTFGMHPEQIRTLGPDFLDKDTGRLAWKRVKNRRFMGFFVPEQDREKLSHFLEAIQKRPLAREVIWRRMKKLTTLAGYKGGPRVLRKTFILNELRRYADNPAALDFVAARAGCSKDVVIQHYLDLCQVDQVFGEQQKRLYEAKQEQTRWAGDEDSDRATLLQSHSVANFFGTVPNEQRVPSFQDSSMVKEPGPRCPHCGQEVKEIYAGHILVPLRIVAKHHEEQRCIQASKAAVKDWEERNAGTPPEP